jgi:cell division protein FtsN
VATTVPGDATASVAPGGGARDVKAPEIFSRTDKALWDGRPSLGGVWVAHASVKDPQRVVMRNPENGREVTGALFRREIDNPGPSLQLSSDAAEALGLLAGQPATIEVVALKRVEAPPAPAPQATATAAAAAPAAAGAAAKAPPPKPGAKPAAKPAATAAAPAPAPAPGSAPAAKAGTIEQKPLDPVASTAAAAIEKAAAAGKAAGTEPAAPAAAPGGAPAKPLLQVGIFSTRENADTAAAQLTKAGFAAQVKENKGEAKTLWRVLIGPMATAGDLEAAIAKVKSMGYADAYPVKK